MLSPEDDDTGMARSADGSKMVSKAVRFAQDVVERGRSFYGLN
jgi:hypothetical protein